MSQKVERFSSRLPAIARPLWAAALTIIIVGTLLPAVDAPGWLSLNDKLMHFTGYFVLGFLGGVGWPEQRWNFLLVMPLIGFGLEILQAALDLGRHFEITDALANSAGVALGVAASIAVSRATRAAA